MTSSGTTEQSYIFPPAKPSVHRYFYYYFFFTLSLSTRFSRYSAVVDFRGRVFNTRYTFVRINGRVVIFFVSRPWRRRRPPTRARTRQCHLEPCVSNQRRWRRRESELVFIARRTSRSHRNRRLRRGIENRRRILLSKDLLFVRSRHILFCIIYANATVVVFRVWIHGQRSTNTVGVHCAREQVNKDRGQREKKNRSFKFFKIFFFLLQ